MAFQWNQFTLRNWNRWSSKAEWPLFSVKNNKKRRQTKNVSLGWLIWTKFGTEKTLIVSYRTKLVASTKSVRIWQSYANLKHWRNFSINLYLFIWDPTILNPYHTRPRQPRHGDASLYWADASAASPPRRLTRQLHTNPRGLQTNRKIRRPLK